MPEIHTPDWVKDAIFYQIFPDRFARSDAVPKSANLQEWGAPPTAHGYQGGDLIGVLEHLDYLVDLGVNAIYFNPIFQSGSNHRYHTHDYYRVDPMLGGDEALRSLLDAAHERGIRIILDGVFNHASRGFLQFHDLLENGKESAYLDWFTIKGWPLHAYDGRNPNYSAWWNMPALPKLNTATPAVREFLLGVAEYWIRFGADGWRLDVPTEIDDDEFWREFRRRVRAAKPDAYIVGEIWDEAEQWLHGDQFDAVMNYIVARAALGFFGRATMDLSYRPGGFELRQLNASGFAAEIERMLALHPPEITYAQLNLLDSHDTARFLHQVGGDRSALELAILFLMTIPGAPSIYYGTEIGVTGGPDPECRRAFPWDENAWDPELRSFVKRAIALRKSTLALRRGDYRTLHADGDVVAFGRRLADDTCVVVFNASTESQTVRFHCKGYLPEGNVSDLWGAGGGVVSRGMLGPISLPARTAAVFSAA